jgi:2-amino-4-hydroxy-6-hydroxymethyldihydropteridine diphosphokinase
MEQLKEICVIVMQCENGVKGTAKQEESDDRAILIGLGANLPSRFGSPEQSLAAALRGLEEAGVTVSRLSRFWRSRPVPVSDQPWFVNGVARVATDLPPEALLALLHRIEADFGRVRGELNAARPLDLDLLAYGRLIRAEAPVLPHPRLAERAFVLLPLAEVAPSWRHPVSGCDVAALIRALPADQEIAPL